MPATVTPPRPYSFGRKQPGARWQSVGVSIAITGGLFAAAFVSMQTVLVFTDRDTKPASPVMVPLSPPMPRPREIPPRPPLTKPVAPKTVVETPTSIPVPPTPTVPIATQNPVAASVDTASAPVIPRTVRDTAAGVEKGARPTATSALKMGAPIAPAGVSNPSPTDRAARDPEYRISSPPVIPLSVAEAARRPPNAGELADIRQGQQQAQQLARRSTTAGNGHDVHIPVGNGLGGAGATGGGGGSVGLPLFSSGPSRAQRARDEIVDADNRARLGRLALLIKTRRDSAVADSLRRDSLRADALRARTRRDSVDRVHHLL